MGRNWAERALGIGHGECPNLELGIGNWAWGMPEFRMPEFRIKNWELGMGN